DSLSEHSSLMLHDLPWNIEHPGRVLQPRRCVHTEMGTHRGGFPLCCEPGGSQGCELLDDRDVEDKPGSLPTLVVLFHLHGNHDVEHEEHKLCDESDDPDEPPDKGN